LHLYSTDAVMPDHAARLTPKNAPLLERSATIDMDEHWVRHPAQVMPETFHWSAGEGFERIVEDVLATPADTGVIAERFRLLPDRIEPLLLHSRQAVWLLPTPEFRRQAFQARGTRATPPAEGVPLTV
jgi:hypothetical protein